MLKVPLIYIGNDAFALQLGLQRSPKNQISHLHICLYASGREYMIQFKHLSLPSLSLSLSLFLTLCQIIFLLKKNSFLFPFLFLIQLQNFQRNISNIYIITSFSCIISWTSTLLVQENATCEKYLEYFIITSYIYSY